MARAFFKAGFIESWGRGFKKIREELDRVNMPMPNVEENCGGVLAVMKRFTMEEIIARREGTSDKTGDNVSANVSANVRVNVRVKALSDGTQLTNRQQVICTLIKDNPFVTAKEMSDKLSVAERTVFRDLSVLQKSNIIRHEGGDKTGIWVILE